jgi:Flp pilus assembly protein TadG
MRLVRTNALRHTAPRAAGSGRLARGQSLVEFALILTPLLLLLLGIIQMGFVFNGYVTLSSATREAARSASIYVYDRTLTKAQNDAARMSVARSTLADSMGLLKKTAPQLATTDQTVTYSLQPGVAETETRVGQNVTVHTHYHMDMMIPFISALLPLEDGRLALDAEVTMVIN